MMGGGGGSLMAFHLHPVISSVYLNAVEFHDT